MDPGVWGVTGRAVTGSLSEHECKFVYDWAGWKKFLD